MKRTLVLITLTLALAICAGPAYAILNGVPDGNAHPYVGMATGPRTGPEGTKTVLCSGARISEHKFLTAGHCFDPRSEVTIRFAHNNTGIAEADGSVYTGTFTPSSVGDVGIVYVTDRMSGDHASLPRTGDVDALPMRQLLTSVGYGLRVRPKDYAGQVGQRYQASSELIKDSSSTSGSLLKLSANPAQGKGGTCFGDSGGPTLHGDTIVGITHGGTNFNCAGITYAQRIDLPAVLSFITGFAP